jgi:hypothetical protein
MNSSEFLNFLSVPPRDFVITEVLNIFYIIISKVFPFFLGQEHMHTRAVSLFQRDLLQSSLISIYTGYISRNTKKEYRL